MPKCNMLKCVYTLNNTILKFTMVPNLRMLFCTSTHYHLPMGGKRQEGRVWDWYGHVSVLQ